MADRRKVAGLAIFGLALGVFAVIAVPRIGPVRLGSPILGINAEFTPALLAEDVAAGLTLFAAGIIAWVRQPANPIWRLMVASYFADFIWLLAFVPNSLFWTASVLFVFVDAAIFANLVVAFPTGHLRSSFERRLVAALYAYAIVMPLIRLLFWDPKLACDAYCPRNLLLISPANGFADVIESVTELSVPAVGALLGILLLRHWRTATAPSRRAMLPLVLAFPGLLLFAALVFGGYALGLDRAVNAVFNPATWVLDFILPIAFLLGAIRLRMTRGSIATSMLELGAVPTPGVVQSMLRRQLGDASITVLRWSEALGGFVDDEGSVVQQPSPGDGQAMTILERDGRTVGAVIHDVALLDDPALQQTIRHAATLAMEATDIRDELRARGGSVADLPKGEVTFLFADIEQSTALLASLGSRYAGLIDELRRVAADLTESHGGRVVDARGDELFLAFADPAAAVATAVDLTRRLGATRWPDDVALRVRIGLHTGHPELTRSGYVGLDVHQAARIMAATNGGQVIASRAVVQDLGDLTRLAVTLRPLGDFALRGIPEPVALVAVEGAGLGAGPAPRAERA